MVLFNILSKLGYISNVILFRFLFENCIHAWAIDDFEEIHIPQALWVVDQTAYKGGGGVAIKKEIWFFF